ncbi:type IV secretory system conjugative DNA transfer family protein [Rhodovulum sp. PH10]|uniref:type IV secretory system conjugative DNA transfer family protein n=1 Tax=Rhodovulum sp. PH10 TaxID=1187851 RepID=UPI00068B157E|nr:type IV secretory system conjugative DNA transfer family protein [Rhodovulum sp. PH10]
MLDFIRRLVGAAMVFGLTLAFSVLFLAMLPGWIGNRVPVLAVIGFAAFMAYGFFSLLAEGPEEEPDTFGGARYAESSTEAEKMSDLLGPTGIYLGEMVSIGDKAPPTLRYHGNRHLLTVAPTRTGKGTCAIIPNLLTLNQSVVCIDPKGQNAAVTSRARRGFGPVYLLNPFNEHNLGTARFNPLAHLTIDSPNLIADVASLADALILTEGKEPHWPDSARDLVSAFLLHLIATEGTSATLPKMRRLVTQNEEAFLTTIVMMSRSPYPFISQPADRFKGSSDEIKNIISTAITQTKFLDDPAIARTLEGNDFSIGDLKRAPGTVFIILPARYISAYARYFRLLVVSTIDQLTATPGGVRTLLLLDEFAQLGHLSAVETAFGLAAGYNVQLWPFIQDLNQLRQIYDNRWQSLLANAGVVQWFTPNDTFTAEYLSNICGQRTITTTTQSRSTGANNQSSSSITYGETGVPLIRPQELTGMTLSNAIITLAGLQYPIHASRTPYYAQSALTGLYDADPFHA